jgi:cell division protein FtsB
MRRGATLLVALYAAFMSLTIQTFIWGEKGILAYQRLENYKERLEENEERLREIHARLDGRFERYTDDRETIELSARSLGYYQENETKLYVEGYEYDRPFYLVGRSVGEYNPLEVDPLVFRIVAILIGIITFIGIRYTQSE